MGIVSYVGSFFSSPPPNQKFSDRYVLVTGCDADCDSGIGSLIARKLHRKGYFVFAGCNTEKAFKELISSKSRSPSFKPFLLDVTKETSIQQCLRMVETTTKEKGLFALINNAGCNEGFAFEFTSNEQIEKTMEVNFMGPIKIIKELLPFLRKNVKYNLSKEPKDRDIYPRIINMTSILGRTTIPFYGAYSASKHALEAMLDTIRVELLPWKIHVSMIEPGPLINKSSSPDLMGISKKFFASPEINQTSKSYGEDYIQKAIEFWKRIHSNQENPLEILQTVIEAVEVGFPKDRYVVGRIAKMHVLIHNVLPGWIIDLAWGSMIRLVGAWPKEVKELEDVNQIWL
ncbi:6485_t:CDS:2 [Diversispora eburnea]|uniref:6485_t:CDS:1 n=1 Tax=Diversispora eburnea TaxID=1213867 RepID=A0A9N8V6U4_9GLOM|nr:6485_t:CDS:2 [Diversispora eburnea]